MKIHSRKGREQGGMQRVYVWEALKHFPPETKRLGIVLPYEDHLFSVTQALLPRVCSNQAREIGNSLCPHSPSPGIYCEMVYKPHPALNPSDPV